DAWRHAAQLWGPKVGNWMQEALDVEAASADAVKAGKPDDAAKYWSQAAADFQAIGAWQMVAVAWDRSAGMQVQANRWDRAAAAWESAAQAMAQSTSPDWAAVGYEYAGRAWGVYAAAGNKSAAASAATDWEAAAKLWQQ